LRRTKIDGTLTKLISNMNEVKALSGYSSVTPSLSLSIDAKIDRAQRLLRMLEEDAPLLALRVAQLNPEHQQSAKSYAAELTAKARAELEKLIQEGSFWDWKDSSPQAAD
jgi:hypothetical protein